MAAQSDAMHLDLLGPKIGSLALRTSHCSLRTVVVGMVGEMFAFDRLATSQRAKQQILEAILFLVVCEGGHRHDDAAGFADAGMHGLRYDLRLLLEPIHGLRGRDRFGKGNHGDGRKHGVLVRQMHEAMRTSVEQMIREDRERQPSAVEVVVDMALSLLDVSSDLLDLDKQDDFVRIQRHPLQAIVKADVQLILKGRGER